MTSVIQIAILSTEHVLRNEAMAIRKIAVDVPESVLLAEKSDERSFARELQSRTR